MQLYTVLESSKLLGVSQGTVRKLINEKSLLAHRVGEQIRVSDEQIKNYLEGNQYKKEKNKRVPKRKIKQKKR